jgi:enolase
VDHVNVQLAAEVHGMDANAQSEIDAALRAADGTADLWRLGANAVLAVSVAAAVAAAASAAQPLYRHVARGNDVLLPMPMVNIISGGAHAGGAVDIQDFLAVPVGASTFADAIEFVARVRAATAAAMVDRGHSVALVADEGGFAAPFGSNREALELLTEGIERSGLRPGDDVGIAIDVAATQFHDGERDLYRWPSEHREMTAAELIRELATWCADFPVVSMEDVLQEDDWQSWTEATGILGDIQVLGDDLFVTSRERLAHGIETGAGNAILVKPNQTGTLSDARTVLDRAHDAGYATVLSARSGESEDHWLADLAVGWGAGQIKVGSLSRSERTAKWNRLLEIESKERGVARLYRPQFHRKPQ